MLILYTNTHTNTHANTNTNANANGNANTNTRHYTGRDHLPEPRARRGPPRRPALSGLSVVAAAGFMIHTRNGDCSYVNGYVVMSTVASFNVDATVRDIFASSPATRFGVEVRAPRPSPAEPLPVSPCYLSLSLSLSISPSLYIYIYIYIYTHYI